MCGDLVADVTGEFAGNVVVPAGIVPGARTLQMNGYAPDGSVRMWIASASCASRTSSDVTVAAGTSLRPVSPR